MADIYQPDLLPSNFVSYAKCIAKIFSEIITHSREQPQKPIITIYTLLSTPLERWFNVSYNSKAKFFCNRYWWSNDRNGYLDEIKKLANDHDKFVVFRLVGVNKKNILNTNKEIVFEADPRKQIIKMKNDQGKITPLLIDYKNFKMGITDGINYEGVQLTKSLIPEHDDILIRDNPNLYIIGEYEGNNIPAGWMPLVKCFEGLFHTGHLPQSFPETLSNGVFYKYIDTEKMKGIPYLEKDDLFIVQIKYATGHFGKPFTMIFNQDTDMDTSGIRLLDQNETDIAITTFKGIWSNKDVTDNIENVLNVYSNEK